MLVLPLSSCSDTNLLFFKNHKLLFFRVQHLVYGIYSQIFVVIMYYSVVWSPAFMGIVRFWHTAIMVNKYSLFLYFLMNLASLLKYLQFYLSSQMAVDHLHYNTLIFSHSFEMNE